MSFQTHVGGIKPWFGKRYHFEPKEDITAFKLSQFLILIGEKTHGSTVAGWQDLPEGIPAPFGQHFRCLEF